MKKKLGILCGVPGSGKSTWARRFANDYKNIKIVSRDVIRFALLDDDESYFAKEDDVFREYIKWIQELLNSDDEIDFVIADATHLSEGSRNKLLNHLNLKNVEAIHAFWFDVSEEVCQMRNSLRTGRDKVPANTITKMCRQFAPPKEGEKYNYIIHKINDEGELLT